MKNIFKSSFLFLALFSYIEIYATLQVKDIIIINNKKEFINILPMEMYFYKNPEKRPKNGLVPTSLYRGYRATFIVKKNELLVIDIEIKVRNLKDQYKMDWKSVFKDIFPNQVEFKIDWVSTFIVVSHGIEIGPKHENYTIFEVENGNILKERKLDHIQYSKFLFKVSEHYNSIRIDENADYEYFIDSTLRIDDVKKLSIILDNIEIIKKTEFDNRLVGFWKVSEKSNDKIVNKEKCNLERKPNGTFLNKFNVIRGTWWTEKNILFEYHFSTGLIYEYKFEVLNKKRLKLTKKNKNQYFFHL